MLRQQKGNVKRKKTIDAKKEAARKEAARKEAESKRLQLFGGFKKGGRIGTSSGPALRGGGMVKKYNSGGSIKVKGAGKLVQRGVRPAKIR